MGFGVLGRRGRVHRPAAIADTTTPYRLIRFIECYSVWAMAHGMSGALRLVGSAPLGSSTEYYCTEQC